MSERAAKYLSIRELRPALPSVIRDVAVASARYVVTRRGKPEAVLLGIEDYGRLLKAAHSTEHKRFQALLKKGYIALNREAEILVRKEGGRRSSWR